MGICSILTQGTRLPVKPRGRGCSASGSSAHLAWPHKERSSIGGSGDQTSMLLPGASATCMTTTLRPHAESVNILLLPSREQKLERSSMKLLKVRLFSCVVGAVLIALLLTTAVAQAQAAPWTVVPSPNPGVAGNELLAAASVSTNDVWAVGLSGSGGPPLIEHWNGTSWSVARVPKQVGILTAVTAVSASDVWAVGYFRNASNVLQTLIEHWNGHKWSVVSSPNAGTQNNQLAGVTAVSATDIWAVGNFEPAVNVAVQTLTEHWNGTAWSVVSSPGVGSGFNTLQAAAAVSTNEVWAVGQSSTASGGV